jgi:hypothetical protein
MKKNLIVALFIVVTLFGININFVFSADVGRFKDTGKKNSAGEEIYSIGAITGTLVPSDSNTEMTGGVTVFIPKDSLKMADGSGDYYLPNGNLLVSDGTVIDQNTGIATKPDGTTVDLDGAAVRPDGTLVSQDGTVIGTDVIGGDRVGFTIPGSYEPLSPIKGPDDKDVPTNSFSSYLQAIYRIGIGACFVLGVIMFTWAGIEYIVSESMDTKGDAKKRIIAALTGLAIALASYIILQTINPDLLIFSDLNVSTAVDKK